MKSRVVIRSEIFLEDGQFVALCRDLDVSSFGDTVLEARTSLKEAVEAFLEECELMGTLEDVLSESGFALFDGQWLPRQPVSAELVPIR